MKCQDGLLVPRQVRVSRCQDPPVLLLLRLILILRLILPADSSFLLILILLHLLHLLFLIVLSLLQASLRSVARLTSPSIRQLSCAQMMLDENML